jgi:hypothetical protein
MAHKCVSAHMGSAWQQKPGVMHRYAKDTILKKLFPPVLLRICVSVCELKKSQPKAVISLARTRIRKYTKDGFPSLRKKKRFAEMKTVFCVFVLFEKCFL